MSHTLTSTNSTVLNGGNPVAGEATYTGSTVVNINESVALNQTDYAVAVAFNTADVVKYSIVSSHNCTLETNSSGSPADTIALKAGIPLEWDVTSNYHDMHFTANVTIFYITNTTALTLKGVVLLTA
jgi:hypothetical protein